MIGIARIRTDFVDALYVSLAEANNRPRPNLGSATPLEVVHHQAEHGYFLDVDDVQREAWNPFRGVQECVVHDLSDPKRKPYINFEYLRYKGPGLLALPQNESRVRVKYDRRDIRQVEIFCLNGQGLGSLACPPSWQSYAHGVVTRRYLFKHCRQLVRKSLDPLTEFLRRRRKQISHPSDVTKFLSIYQEFIGGFGLPTSLWQPPLPEPEIETSPHHNRTRALSDATSTQRRRYWSIDLNPGV